MTYAFSAELSRALEQQYAIERELTGGGMSRVFVAVERALNRKVVVKVLKPDLAADVNRERFRREIMLVAQLHHPHIVPVLSAGQHGDLLWYTMPFVEGESLREELRSGRPFSTREVTRVLHDVLDALDFAHTRGVIHRDVKPGNILRQRSHSLVTDFGVAKALSAAMPHSGTTSAGMAIGTPAYMAPEQLAADPSADHRVDLYAVGLLAYELLTGTQPFAASSPQETLAAQLTRMPTPLTQVRPDLPPPLSALITRLLAKNPNDRPRSAADALAELDALTTPADATASRVWTGVRATRWRPRRRTVLLTGAAVLAAGAVIAFGLTRSGSRGKIPVAYQRVDSTRAANDSTRMTRVSDSTKSQAAASLTGGAAARAAATASGTVASAAPAVTATRPPVQTKNATAPVATKAASSTKTPTAAKTAASRPGSPAPARRFATPRRVALLPFRVGRPDLVPTARALADSLRKSFTAAGYDLATDAELVDLLAAQGGSSQRTAAQGAHIGAIVYGELAIRSGEVRAQAIVQDIWRNTSLSASESADLDKPLEALGVVRNVTRSLDRVSWRRTEDPRLAIVFDFDNQTGEDSLAALARTITAAVRDAVARAAQARIVTDSAARATTDVAERREVAQRLGAGVLVAGSISRSRNDSITVRLALRDLSEDQSYQSIDTRVPIAAAVQSLAPGIAQLLEQLSKVNWGPKGQRP